MVKHIIALVLIALSLPSLASISAKVDRTTLTDGETIQLTIRETNGEKPDITKLYQDFEILSQQQSFQQRNINGKVTAFTEYSYTLRPTKAGDSVIPAFTSGSEQSLPIAIKVLPLSDDAKKAQAEMFFFDIQISNQAPIIGEEVLITMKLYFAQAIGGSLEIPSYQGKLLEAVAPQTEYQSLRNGRNYQVYEQQFRFKPNDPGMIELAPFGLKGQTRSYYGQAINVKSDTLVFNVQDIPADFPDNYPWIVANDVSLTWSLAPQVSELDAGDSINFKFQINAEGLAAESIPDYKRLLRYQGFKAYPDESSFNGSVRAEVIGLIALDDQTSASISGFKFPWYDADERKIKWTSLPETEFSIKPIQKSVAEPETRTPESLPAPIANDTAATPNWLVWLLISSNILFAAAALVFAALWRKRSVAPVNSPLKTSAPWQEKFQQGLKSSNYPLCRSAILDWATSHSGKQILSLNQVADLFADDECRAVLVNWSEQQNSNSLNTLYQHLLQLSEAKDQFASVIKR